MIANKKSPNLRHILNEERSGAECAKRESFTCCMLRKSIQVMIVLVVAVLIIGTLPSCVTKKAVYFRDISDTSKGVSVLPAAYKEPVIQPDDIVSITIQTIDPQSAAAVNQGTPTMGAKSSAGQGGTGMDSGGASGFLVDKAGNVEVPMLGKIQLSGLTTYEAREKIRAEAARYYKDPTVQVRFMNYKITVIGEVTRPATYTVPNEKVTILDAIGMAGDLTIFGRRDNVMLIRDHDGKKDIVRLNLTSSKIIESPYFYLQQNDVIYVEPGKAKIASNNSAIVQTITVGISVITLLVTILRR